MAEYQKLVRDGIPRIIAADGETPVTRILSDDEYEQALIEKLGEEYREFVAADTTEAALTELADIKEVLKALANHIGSEEQVEALRVRKAEERGGFDQRIFLERTE